MNSILMLRYSRPSLAPAYRLLAHALASGTSCPGIVDRMSFGANLGVRPCWRCPVDPLSPHYKLRVKPEAWVMGVTSEVNHDSLQSIWNSIKRRAEKKFQR